jgi:uncharacterized membrane protein YdfJ with MMPL/SSD domain
MAPALDSISQSLQAAGITDPADLEAQLNQLQQGIELLAVASRQVADGVRLLVDQTKTLGAGLAEASAFLLSMKNNANTPSMAGFYIPAQILNGDKFRSNYDRIFKKHESNPINPNARNLEPGQREVPSRRHFRADWKQPS